jgi:transcriptional regulator with PAS, ATPase and Fis domain
MTIDELRHKVITSALKRHKGNAEKAAWDLKVSARTVYSFKAKEEQDKVNEFLKR